MHKGPGTARLLTGHASGVMAVAASTKSAVSKEKQSGKMSSAKRATAHLMPPPKGTRRVSHARIKAAVKAVIRARAQADA